MFGIETLWSPGASFDKVKESRTGAWLVPFVVLYLVTSAVALFHFLRIDMNAEMREVMEQQMAASGQPFPPELENMLPLITGATFVMAFLAIPFMILVIGFCAWLASKILQGTATFGQALGVVVRAKMPLLIGTFVGLLVALVMAEPPGMMEMALLVKDHPAAWLGAEATHPFFNFSRNFSVFALWSLGLLGYGTHRALGLSKGKTWLTWGALFGALVVITGGLATLGYLSQSAMGG